MKFFEQVFFSFKYYGETFRFIDHHRLYRYLIIPSLLSLGTAVFITFLAWRSSDEVLLWLTENFRKKDLSGFPGDILEFLFAFMIRAFVLFLYLKVYRYLLLLVLAPSFSVLSRKIQGLVLKGDYSFSFGTCCLNILRSVRIAVINFFRDIFFTVLIMVIALIITWMAPLGPIAVLVVESYYFGYSMLDYRNQFLGINSSESKRLINANPGLAVGNGLCFNLVLLIPLVGIIIGPVLALIAGGLSMDHTELNPADENSIHKSL